MHHQHSCWGDRETRFTGRGGRGGFRDWGKHFGRGGPGGAGGGIPFGRFVGDGDLRLIVLSLLA